MRTAHVLACASALLLATGALAAGCISSSGDSPDGGTPDGGPGFDANVAPSDGGPVIVLDASDASFGDAGQPTTLAQTPVDFGLVNCGTGAASQTYAFTNTSSKVVTYTATITAGASVFGIEDGGASGSVSPGAAASITLDVGAIPTTSTAGTPISGTLDVQTNLPAPFADVQVPLTVTPQGGTLSVSPVLAGFGQVQLATDGTPIPLSITNTGNASVTFTIGAPAGVDGGASDTEFGVTYPGSPSAITLAPGASFGGDAGADAGGAVTFDPTTAGLKTVSAPIVTSDALCASATSIAMSGTGTAAQVSVGPDPLPFGTILCGQTGTKLTVTILNSSPGAVTFTDALTLGGSSPYTISTAGGTIPGGTLANPGKATIDVTPKKINAPASVVADAFDDTLVVTPTAPDVSPTTIHLQESAAGAILGVTMATTDFTTVSTSKSLPFSVKNTGNRDAPLTLVVTGTGYAAAFTGTSTATANNGTAPGNVTFTATNNTSDPGTLKVTTTEALCAATPATINLSAVSQVAVAAYAATPIALDATCGSGAGTGGSLSVTNNGDAPLTISGVKSANGTFTFGTPATIDPGKSGSITLTAAAIAVNSGPLGGSTLDDTLSFTTNEPGNPTHGVSVTVAVSGANLKFGAGTSGNAISVVDCSSANYSVSNTGNMDGYIVAGGTYPVDSDSAGDPDMFEFKGAAFSSSTLVPAGGQATDTGFGHDTGICGFHQACAFSGTQTFSTTNAAGGQAGICVSLPTLNMSLAMPFNCDQCC